MVSLQVFAQDGLLNLDAPTLQGFKRRFSDVKLAPLAAGGILIIHGVCVVQEGFDFVGGRILPPNRPGLGIELNEEVLRRYKVA